MTGDPGRGTLMEFAGLRVESPAGLLTPRPWTELQARWAVDLVRARPPGPVVELCTGGGHIGLAVARATGRRAVLVDRDAEACRAARRNARRNGLADQVEVRRADVGDRMALSLVPAVVLADPPYIPSDRVARFPRDPVPAIDGGPDGLAVARRILHAVTPELASGVPLLLQLGGHTQVMALDVELAAGPRPGTDPRAARPRVREVRTAGPGRAVALVGYH